MSALDGPAGAPHRGLILPSTFERLDRDGYHTIEADWILSALLKNAPVAGRVLEPAAGRGHLVVELRKHGLEVTARDLHAHPDPLIDDIEVPCDLDGLASLEGFDWLVTNLPFTDLDRRIARLLELCVRDGVGLAVLARLEWLPPAKRAALVHQHRHLTSIVMLTRRPRWIEGPGLSPRHNFCWIVWSARPRPASAHPSVFFEGRKASKGGEEDTTD